MVFPATRLLLRALIALLALTASLAGASHADAAGSPNLALTVSTPSQALAGDTVPVQLRATTPGGSITAHNLSYRVVLPGGSSYVVGSADAAAGEPTIISNQPVSGQTTLLWQNVAELAGGAAHTLGFQARPSTSTYGVNTSWSLTADAYASDDARYVPAFTAAGTNDTTVAHPATASATGATASTQMKALDITETTTSGQTGDQLLRGVHSHQATVKVTVRGTSAGSTNGITLDQYLPAGLEYLGCGGAGADHTTSAATNPGHSEEFSGAGAITVPAVSGCQTPASVATGSYDPPGSQPNGTYTRVRWSIANLTASATQSFSYAIAAPLRSNTLTWTGATPSTAGAQAANLDNNSGPEIASGTTLTDATYASGLYVGLVSTTTQVDTSRTVRDLVLTKTASGSALAQGSTTRWTIAAQAGEYRSAANVAITDTVPDGLCPLDTSANLSHAPQDASDADCDPGTAPSDPYAAATEHADGTWAVSWDSSSAPALAELAPGATATIAYSTRTRRAYQDAYADAAPVLAGDVITNAAQAAADARVICANGAACPAGAPTGTEVSHDGALTTPITATATASLTGSSGSADQQVALSGTNCSTAAYTQGIPSYTPGDRVCWLSRVDFPAGLDTSAAQVGSFLPAGLQLDTTWGSTGDEATSNDTLTGATFDASAATPGPGGVLRWTLPSSYAPGASTFEHRVATRLRLPTAGTDGMLVEHLFKASVATTQGAEIPLRDAADVQLRMPVLALTERITAVNGGAITPTATRTVRGGEVITYRLQVTNTGGRDAEQLEAWDRLPTGLTCADVVRLDAAGACSGGIVRFGATPTTGPTVPAAGGTADLTFDVLIPTTVEVGQPLATTSGVRQYQSTTNAGGAYTYVPATNVDSTMSASANVPAVSDAATLTGAVPTITESRDTSLTEIGNGSTQATIGEVVTYTVSETVPAGLTVRQLSVTDTMDTRHVYVGGSLQQTAGPAATLAIVGSAITLSLPTSYTAATGTDTTFTFTFQARVADTNANSRGGPNLTNQASQWYTPFGTANGGTQTQVLAPLQSTSMVEPALTLIKAADVGVTPVIGGQTVTYTLTLGTSSGTAHESTLVDHVPVDLTPLNAAGNPISDGEQTLSGGTWDQATRTITFSPPATIVAGSPQVFSYKTVVNIPVASGAQISGTANATTTSLPGVDAAERTSASTVTAGYVVSSPVTITVKTASVTKTSDVTTRNPGEKVLYTVDLTLPANVVFHDVLVKDTAPDAIDVDGYEPVGAASCLSGCTSGNEPTIQPYTPVVNGDGTTTVAWDLGDLMLQEPTTRTIRLQYRAHLRTTHRAGGANVLRGQTAINSVRVLTDRTDKVGSFDASTIPAPGGGFDDTSAAATRTITVIEPSVALDKQIAVNAGGYSNGPVTVHDGDTIKYRVTISNGGNAPLYDVAVTDTPDVGLRNVTLAAGVTTTASTDGFTAGDPQMTWLIPGPIAAGATVVLDYTADLPVISSLTDGQHLDNSARVTASWGVPSATRIADGFSYRSYSTGADTTRANYDAPTLTLTKTTGASGNPESSQAEVGVAFPWRVVVTNTSTTETATALTIHDTLPPNWRFVPGSGAITSGGPQVPSITSDAAGDQLTFATGLSLAPGASRTLTYTARPLLAAATTPGTGAGNPHVNTATADVLNSHGSTGDASGQFVSAADTAQAILAVPSLGVDVTPDGATAAPGDPQTFHVHVANAGLVGMTNVQLHASFPSGTPYAPGATTASPAGGFSESAASATDATWTIAGIPAGGAVNLTVPLAVPASLATGTQLVLTVDGTSDQTTGTISDDGDVTLTRAADLAASISAAPNPATAGAGLTYTIGATNQGPSNAAAVHLAMVLPTTVSFGSAPAACTYDLPSRTVTCDWPADLAPSASRSAAIVTTVDPAATTNANASVAASSAEHDPAAGNDTASVTVPIGATADLRTTHTAAASTVAHGAQVTFTVAMKNFGPSDAAAAKLVDTLPAGLSYVSDDATCTIAGQVLTCPSATLASGATRTVHVVTQGDVTGPQTASATASTTTTDADASNDTATASVTVQPAADLQLALSTPATLPAGGAMAVSLTLTNHGPDPATSVAITATLPTGTTLESADPGCTAAGQVVTCAVSGGLANGASVSRALQVRVPTALADQHLTTTGHGAATEVDADGSAASSTTVVGPAADVSVTQGGDTAVPAGGSAQLTFTVHNAGPSPATSVEVTADLPTGAQLASVVPPSGMTCTVAGQRITCTAASLPAGADRTVQLTISVPADWAGSAFTTALSARSATPDPDSTNDDKTGRQTAVLAPAATPTPTPEPAPTDAPAGPTAAPAAVTPTPAPTAAADPKAPQTTLKLKQVASTKSLRGGKRVKFTVTVTNTGAHKATGLKVCGKLPPGLSFPSVGSGFMSGAQLCFRTKELAVGKKLSETFTAKVSRRAKKGSILVTRASVEADNAAVASGSSKGKVVTDGRVNADTISGFTG